MTYKIPKDQIDKLKESIRQDIISELETRKARLDSNDLDYIVNYVKSKIEFKLDSQEIVLGLLDKILTDEQQKRIDFYRQEVFTPGIKSEFIKEVLDQIDLPKDGEKGERGEKGDPGKNADPYQLTEQDKKEIAGFVDVSSMIKDRKRDLAQVIKDIKTGKLKPPSAGIDVKEIMSEIDKILGTDDWRFGLPGDGQLPAYLDYLRFALDKDDSPDLEGIVDWNDIDHTINVNTGLGPILQAGQESLVLVLNNTGSDIQNGKAVYPTGTSNGRPTIALANASTHEKITGAVAVTTMVIPDGEVGFATLRGIVRGVDTSMFDPNVLLWVSSETDGELTSTRPEFPNYQIQIGGATKIGETDGEVTVQISGAYQQTIVNFWNGIFRESLNFFVTSDGSTVTGSLSPANGHDDMTMMFSDGFTMLDTSPAIQVELTPGTDSNPQQNFVYVPKSTKVVTVSTSDWPTTEHIKIATVALRSAATTQTDGALKNQNWNDHIQDTITYQGHLPHICERIRQENAKWDSGVSTTVTIVNTSTPYDVYLSTTSGVIYQLHRQTFPAMDFQTGSDIHVVNHPTNQYVTTSNLNTQVVDANNVTLANRSFSFVVWGVQNKSGQASHLMLNLPSGSYARLAPQDAVNDSLNYSVYSIPKIFQGTGFLIARLTFTLGPSGNVWELYDAEDLRGAIPNTTAGGGAGGTGVITFTGLTDTPSAYTSQKGQIPRVNQAETAVDFTSPFNLGSLKSGTIASPPTGLIVGEPWEDTTDSSNHPILRVARTTT